MYFDETQLGRSSAIRCIILHAICILDDTDHNILPHKVAVQFEIPLCFHAYWIRDGRCRHFFFILIAILYTSEPKKILCRHAWISNHYIDTYQPLPFVCYASKEAITSIKEFGSSKSIELFEICLKVNCFNTIRQHV